MTTITQNALATIVSHQTTGEIGVARIEKLTVSEDGDTKAKQYTFTTIKKPENGDETVESRQYSTLEELLNDNYHSNFERFPDRLHQWGDIFDQLRDADIEPEILEETANE